MFKLSIGHNLVTEIEANKNKMTDGRHFEFLKNVYQSFIYRGK